YRGIPAGGLTIGPNRYGDRTFFSDNWPDKGRHWLPLIDHVSDKATSEFVVTAPSHYQVVSNGRRLEMTDLPGGLRLTHWVQGVPIAPWLYVLGVARFAMQQVDTFEGKPIETWVYPQDREAGFADFAAPTRDALAFYSDYVGPFAYERLANIQSNSVSGGMEAASAILYNEASVTGTQSVRWRNVVIHEIAHQWFGNAVTEATWDDVWLSEGFATYFTLLFIEHAYGRDEFLRGLAESRQRVLDFHRTSPRYTVIHDNLRRMEDVTTSQTYQKGSWVLHMLRGVVGPERFRAGIRAYYRAYLNGHATTADFRRAMETASGMPLGWFFDQWLVRPGSLEIAGTWRYDARARQVRLRLRQVQTDGSRFRMSMDVAVRVAGQAVPVRRRIELRELTQDFVLDVPGVVEGVVLDPDHWVLMQGEVVRGR
ncbi:MAG: M1 family metallopeptidase, partial [Gemmatimonadaceae bacterium]|nr:M1 family metallopeptidase [Gemmatimonadaceae bacterium]